MTVIHLFYSSGFFYFFNLSRGFFLSPFFYSLWFLRSHFHTKRDPIVVYIHTIRSTQITWWFRWWCLSRSRIPVYVGVDIKSPQSTTSNMSTHSTHSNHSTISTDSTGYGWTFGLLHVNTRFPFLSHIFSLLFDFFSRVAFFRTTLLLVFVIDIVIVRDNICVLFLFLWVFFCNLAHRMALVYLRSAFASSAAIALFLFSHLAGVILSHHSQSISICSIFWCCLLRLA